MIISFRTRIALISFILFVALPIISLCIHEVVNDLGFLPMYGFDKYNFISVIKIHYNLFISQTAYDE